GRVRAAAGAGDRMMGPVQVLVVGFEQPAFSGEVLAEFTRLREAGIVRLVDLLLVSRGPDGTLDTLTAPPEFGPELGALAAALALIEHIWAGPLTAAVRRAGGSPLEETWLARADVAELESLIAARGG